MTTSKRPEGTCKDCWAQYEKAMLVWDVLREGLEPKLPKRPAPWPGPRCTTCHRAWVKVGKRKAHARRTENNFGIPAELYWALYEFQGGRCAILRCRATGKRKALAVDHDHRCCPGKTSCGKCVRGLLCGPHNEQFGRNGDDPAVFRDMADYLELSTMDRYVIDLNRAAAMMASETVTAAHLKARSVDPEQIHRFAQRQTADSFALERGPQAEQLDGDTGAAGVEQQ